MLVRRSAPLTALAALSTAAALGGCMVHSAPPVPRASIKDPVAVPARGHVTPAGVRAVVAAPRSQAVADRPRGVGAPTVAPAPVAKVSLAPAAPKPVVAPTPSAPAKLIVATPAPANPASSAPPVGAATTPTDALAAMAVAPERVGHVEPVTPPAPEPAPSRGPVVLQPAGAPGAAPASAGAVARTTADARRAEPTTAAASPAAPSLPTRVATAVPPAVAVPAPVVTPPTAPSPAAVAPPPTVAVTPPSAETAPTKETPPPRAAALSETQRIKVTLARAQDYLRASRISDARTLLEDAARGGHPDVLFALAETWDPLMLQASNPRLARAGDAPRAIAAYEAARARGAAGADARIEALKALPR